MRSPGRYLRSLDPGLPRPVLTLQAGGVANFFGTGAVAPFVVIYLHNVRGMGLGIAGLAVALGGALSLAGGFAAGPLVDRLGPRRTLATGLVLQAAGYGFFPLVRQPRTPSSCSASRVSARRASGRASRRCSPA